MGLDAFTPPAQRAHREAVDLARHWGHAAAEREHLLLGLLRADGSFTARVLIPRGFDFDRGVSALRPFLDALPRVDADARTSVLVSLSEAAEDVLVTATNEARAMGHAFTGTEHILLALLSAADSEACALLHRHGLSAEDFRASTFSSEVTPK